MDTLKYYAMVVWANVCKWAVNAANWWKQASVKDRVVLACIGLVFLLVAGSALADHKDMPVTFIGYMILEGPDYTVACEIESNDGIHVCWPYTPLNNGTNSVGQHGWCTYETSPFKDVPLWWCSGSRDEVLKKRQEIDATSI